MKKKEMNHQSLPITYEKINLKEAGTKFQNIILSYPFNPLKVDFNNIPWIGRHNFPLQKPFCGLIEQCHREGFVIYSDWLSFIGSKRSGFYREETCRFREKITEHLKDLTTNIGYTKEKDKFVVSNEFKELNSWLNKMYNKLYKMDEKGGWDVAYLNQIEKLEKIAREYKQYRKAKERRLKDLIKKYKNQLENLPPSPKPKFKPIGHNQHINTDLFSIRSMKSRKIPKNLSKRDKIINTIKRYEYNEAEVKAKFNISIPIRNEFNNTFFIYHIDATKENIFTSKEFEDQINEIFRLIGNEWLTLVNGNLMLLGNSVEEIEEKLTFKLLEKYPRVIKNLGKAQKNIKDSDWNDVPHYCCKAIERFYNIILNDKKQYEDKNLSQLINIIRDKQEKLFKGSVRGVSDGLNHLILSALNLIGSIRNRRDSGHGNITDVPEWEAKMCYSFTLLLLRTLQGFKKK